MARILITGATGFIGGHVAHKLRERGHDVVALVRSLEKGGALREAGVELVAGDLSSQEAIERAAQGCEGGIHAAAVYAVGIPVSEQPAMFEANVAGTERALDGMVAAGVGRIVYVSTVGVFGNTRGEVVDEDFERTDLDFLSCYDETKYKAHQVAKDRIAAGAPVIIVQPGGVYGPQDHSELGNIIRKVATGKLPARAMSDTGFVVAHVEDIAEGIVLAYEKGEIGRNYVLGGDVIRVDDLIDETARASRRRGPSVTIPTPLVKLSAPFGRIVGPLTGFPSNLHEAIRTTDGVTYWASCERAKDELGYAPRPFTEGVRQTLEAEGLV